MLLLAFDTATAAITAALHDGSRILASHSTIGAMSHGEQLAPAIAAVLEQAGADRTDLTDVAVGVGPGPYTGLRVGVVTARTLADSLGLRLHGVCTLDVVAARAVDASIERPFVAATDARRKEVYWARYAPGERIVRIAGPDVGKPADVARQIGELPVVGRGAMLYPDLLGSGEGIDDPDAGVLADVVVHGRVDELPAEPLYLRRPDATVQTTRKRAS